MVIITITTNQCLDVNVGMLVIWKYLLHTLKTSTSNKREELGGTLEGTPCKETHMINVCNGCRENYLQVRSRRISIIRVNKN